jgi:uncharacterized protein YaiL (DUF2058 family)
MLLLITRIKSLSGSAAAIQHCTHSCLRLPSLLIPSGRLRSKLLPSQLQAASTAAAAAAAAAAAVEQRVHTFTLTDQRMYGSVTAAAQQVKHQHSALHRTVHTAKAITAQLLLLQNM